MARRLLSSLILLSVIVFGTSFAQAAVKPVVTSLGRWTAGLATPTRLDVDSAGMVYVADPRRNSILRFDQYGTSQPALKGDYRISGSGLAVTPNGSRVYAPVITATSANGVRSVKAVAILDGASGAFLGYLGAGGVNEFQEVGDLDLDAQGLIYVADIAALKIKVYNPATNQLLYSFGGKGTTNGLFWQIRGIAVDTAYNEVYVIDPSSNNGVVRVQVFSLAGAFKRVIAQNSFGAPIVCIPSGIAFDDKGRGYMTDFFNSDLRMFQTGTFLSFGLYGVMGYTVGQFTQPFDVAYDPGTKRLFVANDGARVEVYGIDGGSNPVRKNVAPGKPAILSPASDSVVASATPLLQWQSAIDGDGNPLTYDIKLQQDGVTVQTLTKIGGTSATPAPLAENRRFGWSLQAFDGLEVSGYTGVETFWVDAIPEPPTAPALVAPAADAVLDGNALFSWQASSDPDPFDTTASYRLQIADSADFASVLLQSEQSTLQSAALKTLADYALLQDGATYYWRVQAIDGDGLASLDGEVRAFVYDTTLLKIDATFPGAKVYLGGNHAYSGQYLGTVPVELRDLGALETSLVVERPGFEPYVAPLSLVERGNVELKAVLVPAVLPAGHKARPISAGGAKIQGSSEVIPLALDYDRDGRIDLLTADAGGRFTWYRAIDGTLSYAAGVKLDLLLPAGASPVVVDWNNDGSRDLLVGAADGSVKLYRNFSAPAQSLAAGDAPLNVGGNAIPCVLDLDLDGKKDLIVGSSTGSVTLYRNLGSDAAPLLAAGTPLLPALSGNAAPFASDWDADGRKDLLVATTQHIFLYLRQGDGSFAVQSVLSVEDDLTGKNGKSSSGSGYLGDKLRLYVLDLDGKSGKDLVVGNAAGQLRFAASFGKTAVASFAPALLEKLAQIEAAAVAAQADAATLTALATLRSALEAGNTTAAADCAAALLVTLGDTPLATLLAELAGVL